mmetsp:Transcript_31622/g.41791  ORF Transcript_31622/g.41791 Transcript_31622/m.41791 type:complete len:320 (+) Transcript_31622:2-961(+)
MNEKMDVDEQYEDTQEEGGHLHFSEDDEIGNKQDKDEDKGLEMKNAEEDDEAPNSEREHHDENSQGKRDVDDDEEDALHQQKEGGSGDQVENMEENEESTQGEAEEVHLSSPGEDPSCAGNHEIQTTQQFHDESDSDPTPNSKAAPTEAGNQTSMLAKATTSRDSTTIAKGKGEEQEQAQIEGANPGPKEPGPNEPDLEESENKETCPQTLGTKRSQSLPVRRSTRLATGHANMSADLRSSSVQGLKNPHICQGDSPAKMKATLNAPPQQQIKSNQDTSMTDSLQNADATNLTRDEAGPSDDEETINAWEDQHVLNTNS